MERTARVKVIVKGLVSGALALLLASAASAQSVDIDALIGQLGGTQSTEAEQALIRRGEAAVLPLCGAIRVSSDGAKTKIAYVLGKLNDRRAVPDLTEAALVGPDPITDEAVVALCRLNRTQPSGFHGESNLIPNALSPFKKIRERGISGLLIALTDGDRRVQEMALAGLAPFREERMIDPLIAYMDKENGWGLYTCAWLLAEFDDPRIVPALVRNAHKKIPDYADTPGVNALLSMGERGEFGLREVFKIPTCAFYLIQRLDFEKNPEYFNDLVAMARNKQNSLYPIAYFGLGKTRRKEALPILLEGLKDTGRGRTYAIRALGGMRQPEAIEAIEAVTAMYSPDDEDAEDILYTLCEIDDGRSRAFFLEILSDPDISWAKLGCVIQGISKAKNPDDLALISKALQRSDTAYSWDLGPAAQGIAVYGASGIPLVRDLLKSEHKVKRDLGIQVAAKLWDPSFGPLIAEIVRQDRSLSGMDAFLKVRRDPDIDDAIVKNFLQHEGPSPTAFKTIGLIGRKQVVPRLMEMLHSPDHHLAVVPLAQIDGEECRVAIVDYLQRLKGEEWVLESVFEACKLAPDPRYEAELLALLSHPSFGGGVGIAHIEAIGECGTENSIPQLLAIADEIYNHKMVIEAAKAAITRIRARALVQECPISMGLWSNTIHCVRERSESCGVRLQATHPSEEFSSSFASRAKRKMVGAHFNALSQARIAPPGALAEPIFARVILQSPMKCDSFDGEGAEKKFIPKYISTAYKTNAATPIATIQRRAGRRSSSVSDR